MLELVTIVRSCHITAGREAEFEELAMTEMNVPAVTATVTTTEVVLPGKVEPSGLRLVERALPPPAAGQALVRVESTAVSFAESAMRRGRYYGQPPFPFVPGYDFVGVVDAVGPGVNRSLTGRRVAALTKTGGWATAVLLTAADLVEVPDGVSADEAETLIVNGVTAYQMLHHSAKVQAGQTVLVLGASGGVGTILVQLARHAGARVIGTASPRHHDALRALGVEPIDYRDPDLSARVRELAPGGVDAVFDHLGGASVTRSYRLLNRIGTLVSYSIASKLDDTSPVLPGFLRLLAKLAVWNYLPTRKHASFYNVWAGAGKPDSAKRQAFRARLRTDLTHLFGLLRDGVLTAKIAARYPLAEVATAMELAESSGRTALGKIILVP
jgi:NADPH:quinone reductase-like Zn-dependent oxidoreductase